MSMSWPEIANLQLNREAMLFWTGHIGHLVTMIIFFSNHCEDVNFRVSDPCGVYPDPDPFNFYLIKLNIYLFFFDEKVNFIFWYLIITFVLKPGSGSDLISKSDPKPWIKPPPIMYNPKKVAGLVHGKS